ncbi:MAG: hypothetical protein HYX92_20455 [Chloroflexi bacterium]|nr:hypothetical protein [Chloroflexota bacterium]
MPARLRRAILWVLAPASQAAGQVLRGGSFHLDQLFAACAYRYYYGPFYDWYDFGLRVVLSAPIGAL